MKCHNLFTIMPGILFNIEKLRVDTSIKKEDLENTLINPFFKWMHKTMIYRYEKNGLIRLGLPVVDTRTILRV